MELNIFIWLIQNKNIGLNVKWIELLIGNQVKKHKQILGLG